MIHRLTLLDTPSFAGGNSRTPTRRAFLAARAICLLSIISLGCAQSAPPEFSSNQRIPQSEKQAAVASILKAHPVRKDTGYKTDKRFCSSLKDGLRKGRGVTFLAPTYETADPKDERLGRYQQCRNYNGWASGVANSDQAYHFPEFIGDQKFALFLLPRAKDPQRGELFYTECSERLRSGNQTCGYFSIDLNECMIDGGAPNQLAQYRRDAPVTTDSAYNLSALIEHEHTYSVIDLYVLTPSTDTGTRPQYALTVFRLNEDNTFKQACSWVDDPVDLKN